MTKTIRRGLRGLARRAGALDAPREYLDAAWRADVGQVKNYDLIGALQFTVMIGQGLRDHHRLLDFACGSLRGGKYLIPYLLPGHYVGVEPRRDLVMAGLTEELGYPPGWSGPKRPQFYHFDDFRITRHVPGQFDYILAQSVLSHAGEDVVRTILQEAAAALVPGGRFVATFFEGHAPRRQGWLGAGLAAYPFAWLAGEAAAAGLHVERIAVPHPAGQTWVVMS